MSTCRHIREDSTNIICNILTQCRHTLDTLVVHSNNDVLPLTNHIRQRYFGSLSEIELPVDSLNYPGTPPPFPNVRRMRITIIGQQMAARALSKLAYDDYHALQELLVSFWDVSDDLVSNFINHLRVNKSTLYVGLENDRGTRLPCKPSDLQYCLSRPWLTLIMTAEGLDRFKSQWHIHTQNPTYKHLNWMGNALDNLFTLNDTEGDEIWHTMRRQIEEKRQTIVNRRKNQ
ncbi:hypothetical protein VNI00_016200 [Paramarasmius palmivorus]|uniref:Uncharacterized protein n=1 Tax=Paramarasmius palmivorus TaxID=297713 RepID=A0AAW0BCZ3_9AGAR